MGDVGVRVFSEESNKNIDNLIIFSEENPLKILWMDIEDAYLFH